MNVYRNNNFLPKLSKQILTKKLSNIRIKRTSIPVASLLFSSRLKLPGNINKMKNKINLFYPKSIDTHYKTKISNKRYFASTTNDHNITKNNKIYHSIENSPFHSPKNSLIFQILEKFDEIDKKFSQQTRYYNLWNRKLGKHFKIHSDYIDKSPSKTLFENNCQKYTTYVFRRIKNIQK